MKVTVHSTTTNAKNIETHFFDTYVFETPIEKLDWLEVSERVKKCIEDCTGETVKSVIVE